MLEKFKDNQVIQVKSKSRRKLLMEDDMEVEEEKESKPESALNEHSLQQIKGVFDNSNLTTNYSGLHSEYKKKISEDQLDECFLIEENISSNMISITPFARQGNANKLKDPKQIKREAEMSRQVGNPQFNSKRLLDYSSNTNTEDKGLTLSSQLKDIKFPSMIPSSPYSIRAFTPATPVSLALEMVNWLKLKADNVKRSLDEDGFPPVMARHLNYCKPDTRHRILQNLDNWVEKITYELKTDYSSTMSKTDSISNIRYLYFKLVDELLSQEENNSLARHKKSEREKITKELSKTLYRIEFHKAVFT